MGVGVAFADGDAGAKGAGAAADGREANVARVVGMAFAHVAANVNHAVIERGAITLWGV